MKTTSEMIENTQKYIKHHPIGVISTIAVTVGATYLLTPKHGFAGTVYPRFYAGGLSATPGRVEAARILGVGVGDSKRTVAEAHRRLLRSVHPDVGGSDVLAAKVNTARDVLMGKKVEDE